MQKELIKWNVYEIRSAGSSLNGVMLRGRIRKFGIQHGLNVLVENTDDVENAVRFAVLNNEAADLIAQYVNRITVDVEVQLVLEGIINPVLSKLKVNQEDRYSV